MGIYRGGPSCILDIKLKDNQQYPFLILFPHHLAKASQPNSKPLITIWKPTFNKKDNGTLSYKEELLAMIAAIKDPEWERHLIEANREDPRAGTVLHSSAHE